MVSDSKMRDNYQMYGFVSMSFGESRVQEMNELFDREIASKIEGL